MIYLVILVAQWVFFEQLEMLAKAAGFGSSSGSTSSHLSFSSLASSSKTPFSISRQPSVDDGEDGTGKSAVSAVKAG